MNSFIFPLRIGKVGMTDGWKTFGLKIMILYCQNGKRRKVRDWAVGGKRNLNED